MTNKVSSNSPVTKSKNWTRAIALLIVAGLFVWLRLIPASSHKVDIKLPSRAAAAATPATANQALASDDEHVLTGKEAAAGK
jgi:hypothetical protein